MISGGRPLTGQYKNHQAVLPNTMSDTKREGTTLSWYKPNRPALRHWEGVPKTRITHAVRSRLYGVIIMLPEGTGIRQVPLDLAIEPRGSQLKKIKIK